VSKLGLLKMPEKLRPELSKPFGILLTGDLESNVNFVLSLIKKEHPPKVIIVGDYVLMGFIKLDYMPSLGIYDRKSRRSPFPSALKPTDTVFNPAGHISDEAVVAIRRLLSSSSPSILYVEGEEDLLSLPAIIHSPEGAFVIYGLPSTGMVLIKVDKETKKKVAEILKSFERIS